MKLYHYAMLPFEDVALLYDKIARADGAYLAMDGDLPAVKEELGKLLKEGYRWVRTEGGYAIFEKETEAIPTVILEMFKEDEERIARGKTSDNT